MTNLTMIYCYIMFFALEEVVNIFVNVIDIQPSIIIISFEVLDRINCDNINCFKKVSKMLVKWFWMLLKKSKIDLFLMINSCISYLLLIKRLT